MIWVNKYWLLENATSSWKAQINELGSHNYKVRCFNIMLIRAKWLILCIGFMYAFVHMLYTEILSTIIRYFVHAIIWFITKLSINLKASSSSSHAFSLTQTVLLPACNYDLQLINMIFLISSECTIASYTFLAYSVASQNPQKILQEILHISCKPCCSTRAQD